MTESNNIYLEYNIDVNKLTRDYQKFPLKKITKQKYERIPKEDFVYLYIDCNLPRNILSQYLNVSNGHIDDLVNIYNVKKSPKQWLKNSKQTIIERYGVESYAQTDEWKEKVKQTNLQNIGVEYYTQTDEWKEKVKQTNLRNLGVEYPAQSPIVQEKYKETCLKLYGVENYAQSSEFKNLFKNEEFVKHKLEKEYETKKKNGSLGKSEEENKIYNLLITKFKEVIRQYKSDLYPFPCDFYIPEIDLYIEYQGYWQHGKEPFLGTDNQNKIVESWEENGSEQYLRAIDTWTVRDPIKRNTAKQNNLNWIEFFTMDEFIKWFDTI